MNKKKAYDISLYPQKIIDKLNSVKEELKLAVNGIDGDTIAEPSPQHNRGGNEVVFENENNASIVLGRDRVGKLDSGYGGRGDTQCGAIDLVAGRGIGQKLYDEKGEKIPLDPNFGTDAARIYLSQKCDIDSAFGLAAGSYGKAKTKSAVAIKADDVRIISRENTKIVAGIDKTNSQGGDRRAYYGIELIANNDDKDLQPIVKGENLVEALQEINKQVSDLAGIVETLIRQQTIINSAIMSHTHFSATPGSPTTPSFELMPVIIGAISEMTSKSYTGVVLHKINSAFLKLNYLSKMGQKYINSRFNKAN